MVSLSSTTRRTFVGLLARCVRSVIHQAAGMVKRIDRALDELNPAPDRYCSAPSRLPRGHSARPLPGPPPRCTCRTWPDSEPDGVRHFLLFKPHFLSGSRPKQINSFMFYTWPNQTVEEAELHFLRAWLLRCFPPTGKPRDTFSLPCVRLFSGVPYLHRFFNSA